MPLEATSAMKIPTLLELVPISTILAFVFVCVPPLIQTLSDPVFTTYAAEDGIATS